ncbi:uracil-DNA glycosylase [Sphingobium phenoxybenzoativorans]|uniref:Uracil-DNA glycosylase n=1 Tax=Sphingobium phenoxybenzoativorans TaxID=1592790 RepID=A0A975K3P4_9SPHN|nr:uracil-DNA glycosylase [Sphingobium phenoxybenzoativorans]
MRGIVQNGPADAAESLLSWWALAGVDHAVNELPVNWLRPAVAPARVRPASPGGDAPRVDRPDALPNDLSAFHAWLTTHPSIHEAGWSSQRILPAGAQNAAIMVICDLPDPEDAETGTLLSGNCGALFDAMMAAIGRSRQDIYLSSLSVTRAPGGILHDQDLEILATRMRHHIALAAPQRLLLLGEKTNRALLAADSLERPSGLQSVNHPAGTVPAIASRHPRFLLKHPEAKAQSWRALQYLIEDLPS